MIGLGFSTEIYEWVWFSKNIEYVNKGCFENLSRTSVPKSIGSPLIVILQIKLGYVQDAQNYTGMEVIFLTGSYAVNNTQECMCCT
jgi:hypothetical protein